MSLFMKYKILGFSYGNMNNPKTWSGTNYCFYKVLKKRCHIIKIINSAWHINVTTRKLPDNIYNLDGRS